MTYEPPLSESGENGGGDSVGTGSLLDRGEAALSNVDRVRAIGEISFPSYTTGTHLGQLFLFFTHNVFSWKCGANQLLLLEGVMVYNHLRDKVKSFLQPFAASGTPVAADDIKAYFEKLRGDDLAIKAAGGAAVAARGNSNGGGDGAGDGGGFSEGRGGREQSGEA